MIGEVEMEMNTHHPPLENVTFEMGDASQMEGFNVTFNN